jgi:prolipoprotein diacylglyceryl transferase
VIRPASIPSPSDGTFQIGPLSIHAYGLMIALGVVAGVWLMGRRLEARGAGTRDDASAIGMWGVIAGIIGARLYHVATSWDSFADNLGRIPQIWKGGLGIPGGLLAGTLVAMWAARRRKVAILPLLDSAAPAVPLSQAIGRWGNWFNQELFGKPTDLPWALEVSDATATKAGYPPGTTFHPTFLYESLWNLGLCGVLIWVDRRFRLRPGCLFGLYLAGYGVGRFWIEGLRIDPTTEVGGLRWNQWVAIGFIVLGAAIAVVLSRRQPAPTAPAGSDEPPSTDESTDELTGQSSGSTADEPMPAHDAGSTAESPVPAEADYVAPDE